ncbi:MAG: hypothetical protein LBQ31_08840 [Bacteroidales bacterium]|nr:hypothetical protein [Bacteroidales bacterium]
MNTITVYSSSNKERTLLKNLLSTMNIKFTVDLSKDDTRMSKSEYFAMLEQSIQQEKDGKVVEYTPQLEKQLFGNII